VIAPYEYDPAELHWQLKRPRRHWTPVPTAGSNVFYRHQAWQPPTVARVEGLQAYDDATDPYVWHVLKDANNRPLRDFAGRLIGGPCDDPWLTLTLFTDWGRLLTREARVNGSPGWLPLDWQRRYRPAPGGGYLMREKVPV
jgi:hypothetical protein